MHSSNRSPQFLSRITIALQAAAVATLAIFPVTLSAADWLQFRGPAGSATATAAAAEVPVQWGPDQNVVWKAPLPGPGASSPILFGDCIYLTCYSGYDGSGNEAAMMGLKRHLLCLNRADGTVRWTADIPVKQPEQPRIREGHGYATNTPAADADRVYVFAGKSGVFAFDHNGKQLWQANVGEKLNGWGSAASPVLHGKLVIINASVEIDGLVALDRASGKQVWQAGNIKESWNTPVLAKNPAGKTELVVAIFKKVLGYNPDTGQQLWSCDTGINWYMAPSVVVHEGIAYCIGGRGGGGALAVRLGGSGDVTATHRLWAIQKGSNVSSPVYHSGHLYWMNDTDGTAYCADAKTGNVVYEEKIPRATQVYASPVLANGRIYYTDRVGRTYVVPAAPKFELLATNEVEQRGSFDSSPAVADGRIYMRSNKFLYCIGAKGR